MDKEKKGTKREKFEEEHGGMIHTRRDNEARQDNKFSAYGLAQKIKRRKEQYDVDTE